MSEDRPIKKNGPGNKAFNALTPKEKNALTQQALDTFVTSLTQKVDLHDPKSVENAIIGYFEQCKRNGLRPGNLGLYAALGMSKQDYNDVCRGKNKSKMTPECIEIAKSAVRAIGAYREGLALEGKIHPTTYIFMGKNYDGLEDYTKLEVTARPDMEATLSPEEIAKQIEKDIPIDADFSEKDE